MNRLIPKIGAATVTSTVFLIGMIFSAIYAVLIFLVYFAQTTTVGLEEINEQVIRVLDYQRGGLFFNYDLLGYGKQG